MSRPYEIRQVVMTFVGQGLCRDGRAWEILREWFSEIQKTFFPNSGAIPIKRGYAVVNVLLGRVADLRVRVATI